MEFNRRQLQQTVLIMQLQVQECWKAAMRGACGSVQSEGVRQCVLQPFYSIAVQCTSNSVVTTTRKHLLQKCLPILSNHGRGNVDALAGQKFDQHLRGAIAQDVTGPVAGWAFLHCHPGSLNPGELDLIQVGVDESSQAVPVRAGLALLCHVHSGHTLWPCPMLGCRCLLKGGHEDAPKERLLDDHRLLPFLWGAAGRLKLCFLLC